MPGIDKANLIAPINPSLFKKSLFERLGGYIREPVSADRELQARLVLTDTAVVFSQENLYTKFKYEDSLTISEETDNNSDIRINIHKEIYRRIERLRDLHNKGFPTTEHMEMIHLPGLEIESISAPELLTFNDTIWASDATKATLQEFKKPV